MRKIFELILLTMIFSLLFVNSVAAEEKPVNNIGLHDRLLKFDSKEIQMIDGEVHVPLEKMAGFLNSQIFYAKDGNVIGIYKNENMITYDIKTGITTLNNKKVITKPIKKSNDQFYVSVNFIAKATGFSVDHITEIETLRLTRPAIQSMAREKYLMKMKELLQPSGPIVYLTFDDGPNNFTLNNMDTLEAHKVKGTFFFVGKQINLYPEIVKSAFERGHSLGIHSMTHNRSKVYASSKAFIGEMNSAKKLISNLTGSSPIITRAPYGSVPYVTKEMRNELVGASYKMWDWDVDSNDWKYSVGEYKQIIANVKEGVRKSRANDQHIVVLLHDRAQTVKALPEILNWLKAEGFRIEPYDPSRHVVQNFLKDNNL